MIIIIKEYIENPRYDGDNFMQIMPMNDMPDDDIMPIMPPMNDDDCTNKPNNNKPPVDYLENRNDLINSYVAFSDLHMVSDEYLSQEGQNNKYNGTVWGWGRNNQGQIALNYNSRYFCPVKIGDNKWKHICVVDSYVLAIKEDGTLWGWGVGYNDNYIGWSLSNPQVIRDYPIQISADIDWKMFSAFYSNIIGIKTNGVMFGWGYNWFYELGINSSALLKSA